MHKKLALALTIGYTIFLTVLSLMSINKMPKLGSSFDDKIYHLGAYMLFTMLWYNYFEKTDSKYKILFSAGIAIVYGIIIEVLQGTFTTYRTEDIGDVIANTLGALLAAILILLYKKIKLK